MIPIDGQVMFEIAPKFSGKNAKRQAEIINAISPVLQSTLERYDINTRLRIAHFLGQTCHEAAGYRTTEEFASGKAYEGRKDLGNTHKGDGPLFKGRGLIQLTGRANYKEYGDALDIDLEKDPYQAAEPQLSLVIACEYWKRKKLNHYADHDDTVTITKRINGGLNGLDDRRKYIAKAKAVLARIESLQISGSVPDDRPVIHRGSGGPAVAELQGQLQKLHFPVAVDEDFGPATELAVMQFQSEKRLKADGIVGPATWNALEKALKKAA